MTLHRGPKGLEASIVESCPGYRKRSRLVIRDEIIKNRPTRTCVETFPEGDMPGPDCGAVR